MKLRAIAHKIATPLAGLPLTGVSVDSRQVQNGELFVALRGTKADGCNFLGEAAQRGAAAALVSKSYRGSNFGLPLIHVDDTLETLQLMAKLAMKNTSARVVAVTGSVGKTTTKEFIGHLLRAKCRTMVSPGNSNSQVGLCLAVLNGLNGTEEIVVLEMGMSLAGELARLVQIAPPEVAVLTSVGLSHAVNFASLEAIAAEKAEIFSHTRTRLAVLHHSLCRFAAVTEAMACPAVTFAYSERAATYSVASRDRAIFSALHQGEPLGDFPPLALPGKHNLDNFLAAVAVARYFEMDWETIAQRSQTLALPAKRLEFIDKNGILFVNDSYNASLDSMKAALDSLPVPKGNGRTIAVLGEMMELGSFAQSCHDEVGCYAMEKTDMMFCFGEQWQAVAANWPHGSCMLFTDFQLLLHELKLLARAGDVVLLKGSRSKALWRVLDAF